MSNTFDRQRFVNTIKLDIATNWRRFSKLFFAAMAGLSGLFHHQCPECGQCR